jgi:carboxyl-terminal processing protease
MREVRGGVEEPAPHMVWSLIQAALAGDEGSAVELEFRNHRGGTVTRSVERRPCPWPTSSVAGMPELPVRVEARRLESSDTRHAIGVIAIHFFWLPGVAAAVEDALDGLGRVDAVVVDLRGNLGGASASMRNVASYLVGATVVLGSTVGRDGEMPVLVHPRRIGVRGDRVRPFTGPLALLTDGLTGSASELFAAGLADAGRARVFGEPTAGAALPAIVSPMPNGDRLLHAAFDFVRVTGESLEGRPLRPHVLAPLTRRALRRGRDPALEAALAWLVDVLEAR